MTNSSATRNQTMPQGLPSDGSWIPDHAFLSRRHFLCNTAGGIGSIALAWLLNREQLRAASSPVSSSARPPHFPPRAKRVVQIFCCGGVSHIDTFDYKPQLERLHGQTLEGQARNLGFFCHPATGMNYVTELR